MPVADSSRFETSAITEILDSTWGNAQGEVVLSPGVLFAVAPDGSGRLFDLEGSIHAVDAVGVQMLRHGVREKRVSTAAALGRRYGVDAAQIRRDYDDFVDDLERRRLICPRGAEPPARTWQPPPRLLQRLFDITSLLTVRRQAWVLLGLARVSIRMFGWNATAHAWLDHRAAPAAGRGLTQTAIGDAVRRAAAGHLLGVSCKERSLCCAAMCRSAGIPASVVLGISLFPLASHCWCETPDGCLTDFSDRCEGFTPVLTYP